MNAPGTEFLDTNVLVYAFSTDARAGTAEKLLARGCRVGLQGLNEFANVARRKLGMSWPEVRDALDVIRTLSSATVPMDLESHAAALAMAERYRLSFFDALMVASALGAGCTTFWSEDMQDGLLVDGRLLVRNPFAGAAGG